MADKSIVASYESAGLSEVKQKLVIEKTPKKFIKQRKGRAGMMLDYVEGGYVVSKLNEIFNYMWSFEITDDKVDGKFILVHGKLTAYIVIPVPNGQPIVQPIIKDQYGSADIKVSRDTGAAMDPGDDFKAAATDALKKCASLFGVAQDVYWKQDKAEPRTADEIVYGDRPSTASSGTGMATDSQKKWIANLVATGKIHLDKPVEELTFTEASKAIETYRIGIGK